MSTDQEVTAHYRHGNLEQALLTAAAAMGKDPMHLSPADLMGADEFHIGGAQATNDLAAQLGLTAAMHLLDLGSGLGGPARHLAATHGCRITGIVTFREASATALAFEEATFDGATLLHVGMNIADKRTLCANVHRVLRPGGFFAIYDVMRTGPGDIDFPVPWSSAPETSFVEPPEAYRAALTEAGFTIHAERSRAMFARDFFAALRVRQTQSGAPPLGLQIVMGTTTPQKTANMIGLIDRGVIAPTEMIARR